MVDTFIRRPILASVCSLVLILAGVVAIPTMPVAQYPPLAPPQVTVTTFYTGANAQEVETSVTTPLEQAINGVEGMLYMTSSSTNTGAATINVTFDITRDQDLAQIDVQNRVNQALGRMPLPRRFDLSRILQPIARELPDGLEKRIAEGAVVAPVDVDERFVDEPGKFVEEPEFVRILAVGDARQQVERPAA